MTNLKKTIFIVSLISILPSAQIFSSEQPISQSVKDCFNNAAILGTFLLGSSSAHLIHAKNLIKNGFQNMKLNAPYGLQTPQQMKILGRTGLVLSTIAIASPTAIEYLEWRSLDKKMNSKLEPKIIS